MAGLPQSPRDEQLGAFLGSPPPRLVPPAYRRSALAQSAPLAPALVIGGLGLISLVLAVAFFPRHLLGDWQVSRPGALTAPGLIQSAAATTISENHRRVVAYRFTFTTPAGRLVAGTCYTTGTQFVANESVPVRYLASDPAIACPTGARLSLTSPLAGLIGIFPLFSLVFFVFTVRSRQRVLRILARGSLEEARVVEIGSPFDGRPRGRRNDVKLEARGAIFAVPCYRVSLAEFLRERMEENMPVFILRDPLRPGKVLFPERF